METETEKKMVPLGILPLSDLSVLFVHIPVGESQMRINHKENSEISEGEDNDSF